MSIARANTFPSSLFRLNLTCNLIIRHLNYGFNDLLLLVSQIEENAETFPKSNKKMLESAKKLKQELNRYLLTKDLALEKTSIMQNLKTIESETEKQLAKLPKSIEKAQAYLDAISYINSYCADNDMRIDITDYIIDNEAEVYLLSRKKQIRDRLESIHKSWCHEYDLHQAIQDKNLPELMRSSIFWDHEYYVECTMPWVRLMELAEFPGFDDVMSEIRTEIRDSLASGGVLDSELRALAVEIWQIARTRYFANKIKDALMICFDRILKKQNPNKGCWETLVMKDLNQNGEMRRAWITEEDILTTAAFAFVLYLLGDPDKHFEAARKAAQWLIRQQIDGGWSDVGGEEETILPTCLSSMAIYFSGLDPRGYVLNKAHNWLLQKQAVTGEWYKEGIGIGPCGTTVLVLDTLDLIDGKKDLTFVIPDTLLKEEIEDPEEKAKKALKTLEEFAKKLSKGENEIDNIIVDLRTKLDAFLGAKKQSLIYKGNIIYQSQFEAARRDLGYVTREAEKFLQQRKAK